jgi:hypothetical protein
MTCPFGPSTVSVGVSNNGVGFAATTDLDITVTDFSSDVTPSGATVSPGGSATFAVSVAPVGGPYSTRCRPVLQHGTLPPGCVVQLQSGDGDAWRERRAVEHDHLDHLVIAGAAECRRPARRRVPLAAARRCPSAIDALVVGGPRRFWRRRPGCAGIDRHCSSPAS